MAFDLTVQKPVKNGYEHEVTVNPYIMMGDGSARYFLRGGKVWNDAGDIVPDEDIPDWLWVEVDKMKPDVKASIGFDSPAPAPMLAAAKPAAAPAAAKAPPPKVV